MRKRTIGLVLGFFRQAKTRLPRSQDSLTPRCQVQPTLYRHILRIGDVFLTTWLAEHRFSVELAVAEESRVLPKRASVAPEERVDFFIGRRYR